MRSRPEHNGSRPDAALRLRSSHRVPIPQRVFLATVFVQAFPPMKDLTQGSIVRNILAMAAPMAAGMIFQTLYFLVDLYFVAGLGDAAVAGVGAAGTLMFGIMALTQVLGVGAVALIAQAVGRRDPTDANLVFNQSVSLAIACALATLIGGYALAGAYVASIAADAATQAQGVSYLYW